MPSTMPSTVTDILNALARHSARLTGSWARGQAHDGSDFDFYVPGAQWERFVASAPPGWESPIIGSIGWYTSLGLIDVSYLFRNQRAQRIAPTLRVLGREWRTW